MAILRLQHSFQGLSGLPEDQFVNTFHFVPATLASVVLADLALAVKGFYSQAPLTETQSITDYMAGTSDAEGARIKIYDMADAKPRVPLYDETYNPTSSGQGTINLPNELACCLSFSAPPIAGIPPPQLRGRIYLGPFCSAALTGGGLGVESTVDLGLRNIIVKSAVELGNSADGVGAPWAVYSPTRGAAAELSRFWADDAWDIQRRRGIKPSERVTLTR